MTYQTMAEVAAQAATQPPAPPLQREYTNEERREGMLALVVSAGSSSRATRLLADNGIEVPQGTLQAWKRRYVDEYDELREQYAPRIEERMVAQLLETADYASAVEWKAIEAAESRLDQGKDIDPAKTAVAMGRVKAGAIDRRLVLTGRPTQITEQRSYHEIVRSLVAKGVIDLGPADVQELSVAPPSAGDTDANPSGEADVDRALEQSEQQEPPMGTTLDAA